MTGCQQAGRHDAPSTTPAAHLFCQHEAVRGCIPQPRVEGVELMGGAGGGAAAALLQDQEAAVGLDIPHRCKGGKAAAGCVAAWSQQMRKQYEGVAGATRASVPELRAPVVHLLLLLLTLLMLSRLALTLLLPPGGTHGGRPGAPGGGLGTCR
jgi:hypothetical protein